MKTKKSPAKSFLSLTPAQRDREVAKFDGEIDIDTDTKPLGKKARATFERWKLGTNKASQKRQVTLKLDAATLRRCQAYADKHQLSLSDVVNLGLTSVFRFAE